MHHSTEKQQISDIITVMSLIKSPYFKTLVKVVIIDRIMITNFKIHIP